MKNVEGGKNNRRVFLKIFFVWGCVGEGEGFHLFEAGKEGGVVFFADGEEHVAFHLEAAGEDVGVFFFDDAHDVVHGEVAEVDVDAEVDGLFDDVGMAEGIGSGFAVGVDEPGDAEFDAAEVADDDDEDVGEPVGEDLPVDGFAGGGGGFSVVVCAEAGVFSPQLPGVAVVPGIVVFFFEPGEDGTYFFFVRHREGEGDEAAAFFFV